MWEQLKQTGYLERLVAAIVAGIVLGLPYRRQPGGLRTHMLVTLGAAYFCATASRVPESKDLLRVIQGITSGIGFVGAASVLRKGEHIQGIATAASIWLCAAVGSEAGLGDPVLAATSSVAITFVTWGVSVAELKFRQRGPLPKTLQEKVDAAHEEKR